MKEVFVKGECPECSGHFEFPAEAAGQMFTCPHCGQTIELRPDPELNAGPNRSRMALWITMVLLVAGGLIAVNLSILRCHLSAPAPTAPPTAAGTNAIAIKKSPPAARQPPDDQPRPGETVTNRFAISPGKLDKMPGSSIVYVVGHVRNLDNRQRFGVKVEFSLLNADGQVIGHATDYHAMLDPHGDWGYKAMVMESKAATAEFSGITEEK